MGSRACITAKAKSASTQRTDGEELSVLLANALTKDLIGPSGSELDSRREEVKAILHVIDGQFNSPTRSASLDLQRVQSSLCSRLYEAWGGEQEFNNWSHQAVKISYWSKPFVRFFASDLKEVFVSTGGTVYTTLDSSKRISGSEDLVSHPARTLTNDNSTYEAKILVESDIKQRRVLKYLEGFSLHYTYIQKEWETGKTFFYIEVATKIPGANLDRNPEYVKVAKDSLTEEEFSDRPLDQQEDSSTTKNWLGDLILGECYREMTDAEILRVYSAVQSVTTESFIDDTMNVLEREEFLQFYSEAGNYNDVLSSRVFAAIAAERIRATGTRVDTEEDNYKDTGPFSWHKGIGHPIYNRYLPDDCSYKKMKIRNYEDKMEIRCSWPMTMLLPTVLGIVSIVLYLVYRPEDSNPATDISAIGGIAFGVILGGSTAIKKFVHPDWELADMMHRRYSSKSMRGYVRASRRGLTLLRTLANSKRSVRKKISTKYSCIIGEQLGGDIAFDLEMSCQDLTRYGVFKLCETQDLSMGREDGMLLVRYDDRLGQLKIGNDGNFYIREMKFKLGPPCDTNRFRNVSVCDQRLVK